MKLHPIDVSYGQLAVFQSSLQQPFNDWDDAHVAQGFAWRPGSVAFATLEQAGLTAIEVLLSAPDALERGTPTRIIAVPFTVDQAGTIEVASIADGQALSLAPGSYRLTFEHGVGEDGSMWIRLSFEVTTHAVVAEIIRADSALAPARSLLMCARPA